MVVYVEITDLEINAAMAAELRAEKAAKKLSVRVLSEKSGITAVTLNRILRAERDINVTQLAQLSFALGVDAQELMSRAVERLGGMPALIESARAMAERKGIASTGMSVGTPNNVTKFPTTVEDFDNYRGDKAAHPRDPETDEDEPDN